MARRGFIPSLAQTRSATTPVHNPQRRHVQHAAAADVYSSQRRHLQRSTDPLVPNPLRKGASRSTAWLRMCTASTLAPTARHGSAWEPPAWKRAPAARRGYGYAQPSTPVPQHGTARLRTTHWKRAPQHGVAMECAALNAAIFGAGRLHLRKAPQARAAGHGCGCAQSLMPPPAGLHGSACAQPHVATFAQRGVAVGCARVPRLLSTIVGLSGRWKTGFSTG